MGTKTLDKVADCKSCVGIGNEFDGYTSFMADMWSCRRLGVK